MIQRACLEQDSSQILVKEKAALSPQTPCFMPGFFFPIILFTTPITRERRSGREGTVGKITAALFSLRPCRYLFLSPTLLLSSSPSVPTLCLLAVVPPHPHPSTPIAPRRRPLNYLLFVERCPYLLVGRDLGKRHLPTKIRVRGCHARLLAGD